MDKVLIDKLFKDFYWLFIFSNYIGIIVPIVVIAFKRFRTISNITFAAVIALVALWVNRYLIVVPTLETPYIPIQDERIAWAMYSPTWVEWSLTFGGLAMFGLLFMIASKFVPIISISEMTEVEEPETRILDNENSDKF
jgi:molybdopterin-containing oxidoreductase family membrane subunit